MKRAGCLSSQISPRYVQRRGIRVTGDDVVFDCSYYRLPYEFVIENRGANAVGKYGVIIASRWLADLGIRVERTHQFLNSWGRIIRPDVFDPSTRIAYEVKTGYLELSRSSRAQLKGYRHAVKSNQARKVVYLNVAIGGRVGPSYAFRQAMRAFGFPLVILL